jgi:ankyrin repeat protein
MTSPEIIKQFYDAVHNKKVDEVVELLKNQKIDVNHRFDHYDMKTAAHIASIYYDLTLLKVLVEDFKADLDVEDCYNQVPIENAASVANYPAIKFLLSKKPEHLSRVSEHVNTPEVDEYFEAVENGDLEKTREILNEGKVDVNTKNKSGYYNTALHTACELGNFEMVKMLVNEFKADKYIENTAEDYPEHLTDKDEIFEFLTGGNQERRNSEEVTIPLPVPVAVVANENA